MSSFELRPGDRLPCGATPSPDGVNFSIYTRQATAVSLLLYENAPSLTPLAVLELNPETHRTFFYWHAFVVGATSGLYYTWRVAGPHDPNAGLRFDGQLELLDPWAREVSDVLWNREARRKYGETAIRGRVPAIDDYDWEGDVPLSRPVEESIIYELHVGGFTRHPSADVGHPGTISGLIQKVPYLQSLGITDVELMPIMAFDTQSVPSGPAALGCSNYWGYDTYGFFALHPAYAATEDPRREFRNLVKALHRAGIGVVLDVVLNHTAEGDEEGPIISFKGLVNEVFYHLEPADKTRYRNYSGCGNAVNANHPVVSSFLLECLEYWVNEMHVDGFRLDLAAVLSRDTDGEPSGNAPILWNIECSSILRDRRLIAEPWDAAGLYQLGSFPGFGWLEWNDKYRDILRRCMRGDEGLTSELATRLAGSSDLFAPTDRKPANSINFFSCHDGLTLYDLVAYDHKHNGANGEDNRDGSDTEFSWNSGCEGVTRDPVIEGLRLQRAKNFIALLFLSQGIPMLLAGDERLRTQHGNNNAWCQDNEISWIDWTDEIHSQQMVRFTRGMIRLRKRHPSLRRSTFFLPEHTSYGAIRWHGADEGPPDWACSDARVLRMSLYGLTPGEPALHVMINMSKEAQVIRLPALTDGPSTWHRLVDTSLLSPGELVDASGAQSTDGTYLLAARSVVVLESC